MTALLGTASLASGVVLAVTALAAWVGVAAGRVPARSARRLTYAVLGAALAAAAVLEWALLTHDFGVRYVAENGGRAVPLYFRVTSLWSALEGSLLLWLVVLAGYTAAVARRPDARAARHHPWVLVTLSAVATFFFALALFGGNAFERVSPVPADGPGPNPLLQDNPLMGAHPPLLYLGYVGLAVPFAYAVAALVTGDTGRGWLLAVRRWTLVAWTFLTLGIVLGAWWAYAVLGWGGYWAWDPVENASLLPWLTATALLHSAMVQERRATLRVWNVCLAVAGFVLVLVGTFLTRSGIVDSVHAFSRSTLGALLLGFIGVVLAVVAVLLVWRADRLGPDGTLHARLSRETVFLGNNVLLVGLAFTVLLGTLFPVFAQLADGSQVSVGPPYFNQMAVPVALVVLLLMALGPLVSWGGDTVPALARRVAVPLAVSVALVASLVALGVSGAAALTAFGLAALVLATSVQLVGQGARVARRATGRSWPGSLLEAVRRRRRLHGGLVVHIGVALAAVAVAASSSFSTATEQRVAVGNAVAVAGWTARLDAVERERTAQEMRVVARVALAEDGRARGAAAPELRTFPAHAITVASPAVRSTLAGDVYLTVTEVDPDGGWALLRIAVNPLVSWLWAAGGVMALGAVLAGWPARRVRGHRATPGEPVPSLAPGER
ncbi:heme lyase CcmF/NrfE family subunit [Blastococcus sp. MG754426]|uniref:heme lyase CcmF/NrfE family subunit n=1 Tax=unclassified Blastococcus TaxID=2619396 RepID=UPI001EEF85E4|nr:MULTISPECIES: cytochrome c-type biogenesis CcmF C-terminal domain-containing protein [unclassified Blastococcus]MCF6506054.1 heme lyase CcmF/NrfE family subunit [Blastococcus sp. MG754426]MCF6510560.1 heme lyase CcmF/NrfE family subunit [Blastococcus sp. MG754427]